jgi:copper chaperone CopZ
MKTILNVTGMTCGHCESAVTAELLKLDGVTNVSVDLATHSVAVESVSGLNPTDVATAIDEAGYELVSIS